MNLQERFEDIFRRGNIGYKEVKAFGSHGLFTFWSFEAASRAAMLLKAATFRVRGPVESVDYAQDQKSRKTLHPKIVRVWRVGAAA